MKARILLTSNITREWYEESVNQCGAVAVSTYCEDKGLDYDGLILCGGNDMDPAYYGEEINGAVHIDYARDAFEMRIAKHFIEAGKPVMGICRGFQLLNVYFGGSLHQHISNVVEHRVEGKVEKVHEVLSTDGSIARRLYGERFVVNSIHHQAVKRLGEGLKITMTSTDGGIIEGFEHEHLPLFGVQWHPERMCFARRREDTVDGALIFEYFIKMCEKNREEMKLCLKK